MNRIITKQVKYRGRLIPVQELKPNSNIKIEVECKHGRRIVKWCRRHQLCRKCCSEAGIYNTSPKGRKITWGDKISKAKRGKKFSDDHKKALVAVRKKKYCKRVNIQEKDFVDFVSYRDRRFGLYKVINRARRINWDLEQLVLSDREQRFFDTVGYTILDLKSHLESQFSSAQSWDNYGYKGWHVDHKIPYSWFDTSDPRQFIKCWALNNLQPLWAYENFSKNNHRDDS